MESQACLLRPKAGTVLMMPVPIPPASIAPGSTRQQRDHPAEHLAASFTRPDVHPHEAILPRIGVRHKARGEPGSVLNRMGRPEVARVSVERRDLLRRQESLWSVLRRRKQLEVRRRRIGLPEARQGAQPVAPLHFRPGTWHGLIRSRRVKPQRKRAREKPRCA